MHYKTLFAYQNATMKRLLTCAAQLDETDYREHPGFGHGSLHDIFVHILAASWIWRTMLETGQMARFSRRRFPDRASLQAQFELELAGWQAYLDQLDPAELEQTFSFTTPWGKEYNIPLWQLLQHLILHGMQHAAEIAHLLTLKGQSPGDIDLILYEQ
jgi:uncharacterized damage-inducible protein DinB